jgi:hypothetical protein
MALPDELIELRPCHDDKVIHFTSRDLLLDALRTAPGHQQFTACSVFEGGNQIKDGFLHPWGGKDTDLRRRCMLHHTKTRSCGTGAFARMTTQRVDALRIRRGWDTYLSDAVERGPSGCPARLPGGQEYR